MTPFLTAHWRNLIMLNYACPVAVLEPLAPAGTTLDLWNDEALISVVGFLFDDTRIRGIPVPFHRTFEEVNLRFYVRRIVNDETRRGVVFVRELVPRRAIATVARLAYNEPYLAVRMGHHASLDHTAGGDVSYTWHHAGVEFTLRAAVSGAPTQAAPGSEAEFITEHYWGYTRQRDGSTLEYHVEHPRWNVWHASSARFDGDAEQLYGAAFARLLTSPAQSAFVADGSPVRVHAGRPLGLRSHSPALPRRP